MPRRPGAAVDEAKTGSLEGGEGGEGGVEAGQEGTAQLGRCDHVSSYAASNSGLVLGDQRYAGRSRLRTAGVTATLTTSTERSNLAHGAVQQAQYTAVEDLGT